VDETHPSLCFYGIDIPVRSKSQISVLQPRVIDCVHVEISDCLCAGDVYGN